MYMLFWSSTLSDFFWGADYTDHVGQKAFTLNLNKLRKLKCALLICCGYCKLPHIVFFSLMCYSADMCQYGPEIEMVPYTTYIHLHCSDYVSNI